MSHHHPPKPNPHHPAPAPPAPNPHHPAPTPAPAPQPPPTPVPAPPAPVPAPGGVKALSGRAFVDSLGVNIHTTYVDTPYRDKGAIIRSLQYLGLTLVRDGHVPWYADAYAAMAKAGVRFNYFLPGRFKEIPDPATFVRNVSATAKRSPGAVVSIEGSNEVNNWPFGSDRSMAGQGAVQRALWAAVKADPVLAGLPVYAPSVTNSDVAKGLGDLRSYCDCANSHVYFGEGCVPPRGNNFWRDTIAYNQQPAQGKPTVITETGYSTNPNGPQGCDETTQAKQTLSLFMDAAKDGIAATFIYELVDQLPNGGDPNMQDREKRFGLFRNDWSPKLAATAIRNLTSVLGSGSAQGGSLAYSVAGLPPGGQHVLFQTGDGFVIAIWAEPDIWEESGNKPISAPGYDVTVTLAKPASWEVIDPLVSTVSVRFGNTATATARVVDHPVLVKVK